MSTFAKGPNSGKCLPAYLLFPGHRRVSHTGISTYFPLRTDVPDLDGGSAPGPASRRRSAIARAGRSVTRTSTFGLASHPVRARSPFTVQTIVLIPRRRHSARTPVRASRWCITATSAQPGPVEGHQRPAQGPPDIELHVLGARRQRAPVRLVRAAGIGLTAAPMR